MFNSYKNVRERELLDILRQAIFVFKLQAQGRLLENGFKDQDVDDRRKRLIEFIIQLGDTISFLDKGIDDDDIDLSFISLAERFIKINVEDVNDRVKQIKRLQAKLDRKEQLLERDFRLLDRLQSYLQEEIAQSIQNLFRL